ncbi:MAG: transporter [Monoraphidium minutum]|nr:MAG: transporter [Monoraphidium minutum]
MDAPGQVAFTMHAKELGFLGPAKNWIALAILVVMLVGIASEKVHRMYCAFLGAFAMMGLLLWMNMVPSLEMVTEWLDESTLGLLFGMMILVGQLKNTGLFEVLCATTLKACRGRMWALSLMMVYLTGVVSAFLDNVTTMLLMGPITISMMTTCNRDPRPLLMAQVLFSNIGGTATMVGDPPNVIIGTALSRHLGFVDFIVHLAPGVLIASVPATLLILFMYRSTLLGEIPDYEACLKATAGYHITDWNLMAKAGYVTLIVVLGFLLHPVHHVDPAWFAIIGAALLCLVVAPMEVENVMHSVEWDMLLFFAAQFVMVEAAAEVGMINMIGGWLEAAIRASPPQTRTLVAIEILLWVSAVVSGILDNIPYTITMVPIVELLASAGLGLEIQTLAWALAFGACFGGNATLIGASANIVTATMLDKSGHRCTFVGWLKVGVPLMIVTVAAANLYMLRYAF